MRWEMGRRSTNVDDRRGLAKAALGGGGGLFLVGIIVALLGGDPTPYLAEGLNRTMQAHTQRSNIPQAEQDRLADFTSAVLGSTEDVWQTRFQALGQTYREPQLVLFSGGVRSACGQAVAAMGPFYCPLDQSVYLDLEFFHDLQTKLNAPGDFAQAYVIAHEVGHHVQNLLGIFDATAQLREDGLKSNALSVSTELMADCLAGVWAHDTQSANLLESGDLEEALNAATQIGDDTLQRQSQGVVVPDSFTHGSAKDRYQWFKTGYERGHIKACDTFNGRLRF